MNALLRQRMQDIVSQLQRGIKVKADAIKLVRRSLLLAEVEKDDLGLMTEFYRTVRTSFFELRYPQSDKKILAARKDRPAEKKLEAERVEIPYQTLTDPFSQLAWMALPEKWAALSLQCLQLQSLLAEAVKVTQPEHYLVIANEIVGRHRYLVRLVSDFPWPNAAIRRQMNLHLRAIYDRLEEYGWQCAAGVATGLMPVQAKKLSRFLGALTGSGESVLFPILTLPAVSLEKIMGLVNGYEMKAGELVLKEQKVESAPALSSTAQTVLFCQHAPERVIGKPGLAESKEAAERQLPRFDKHKHKHKHRHTHKRRHQETAEVFVSSNDNDPSEAGLQPPAKKLRA